MQVYGLWEGTGVPGENPQTKDLTNNMTQWERTSNIFSFIKF